MIADNDQTVTVDCAKDPRVGISGNNATVTLTGVCAQVSVNGNKASVTGSAEKVSVAGNENTVNLDRVDLLATTGNSNTVTWKKGVKKPKPKIANPGNKNKISKVK